MSWVGSNLVLTGFKPGSELVLTRFCVPAGGLQAVAELLQVDCEMFGLSSDHYSVTLRRYAGMALTNLTFGDVANKVTAGSSVEHNRTAFIVPEQPMMCCRFLSGHAVLHEGLHESHGGPAQVRERRPAAGTFSCSRR